MSPPPLPEHPPGYLVKEGQELLSWLALGMLLLTCAVNTALPFLMVKFHPKNLQSVQLTSENILLVNKIFC